jgi:hypothetical protein
MRYCGRLSRHYIEYQGSRIRVAGSDVARKREEQALSASKQAVSQMPLFD